jgi:cell division protein FtsB
MTPVPEKAPEIARRGSPPGGPAPLRRKRVLPPTSSASPKRRRALQYLLVFATVVLIVDALVGDRGLMERMRARREFQESDQALEALRRENSRLRASIRQLRDDPTAIESLAREELGLIKPGEVLFIIKDSKPASH